MKKEKRLVYIELASEIEADLCCFCKYGKSMGCECGTECTHPIDRQRQILRRDDDIQSDCWGFRPEMEVSLMADICGIILANGWVEWTYWEDHGKTKIAGRTF